MSPCPFSVEIGTRRGREIVGRGSLPRVPRANGGTTVLSRRAAADGQSGVTPSRPHGSALLTAAGGTSRGGSTFPLHAFARCDQCMTSYEIATGEAVVRGFWHSGCNYPCQGTAGAP